MATVPMIPRRPRSNHEQDVSATRESRPHFLNDPFEKGVLPHGGPYQFEHALQRILQNSYRTRETRETLPRLFDNPETLPTFAISDGTPHHLGWNKMVLAGRELFLRTDSLLGDGGEPLWSKVHYGSRVIDGALHDAFDAFVHNNPYAREIEGPPIIDPNEHPNIAIRTYWGPAKQAFVIGGRAYLRRTAWQGITTWVDLGRAPMTEAQMKLLIALRDHLPLDP